MLKSLYPLISKADVDPNFGLTDMLEVNEVLQEAKLQKWLKQQENISQLDQIRDKQQTVRIPSE